jgi:diguanylate cyclase
LIEVDKEDDDKFTRPRRFSRRAFRVRFLTRLFGYLLASLGIITALRANHVVTAGWAVALPLMHSVLWAALAWLRACRSREPWRTETNNLLIDSAGAGFWVAMMGFDALPSVMLVSIMLMERTAAGGLAFGVKALAVMGLACAVTSAAIGFPYNPVTTGYVVLACLPMLLIYPFITGLQSRRLAEKVFKQKKQLERVAHFDSATGLMNRQQLLFAARGAMDRFQHKGQPSVLVMIDIDNFKQINDQFGHTIGDIAVEQFARLLHNCLRDVDIGGRYGGDEFGIVMPGLQWPEALEAAERLRQQVASSQLLPDGLQCTISVGLAETHPLIYSVTDWVNQADAALYAAKRLGRDCVSVAPVPTLVVRAADPAVPHAP